MAQYWHWVDAEGGGSDTHFPSRGEATEAALASVDEEEQVRFVVLYDDEKESELEVYQVFPGVEESDV